MTGTGAPEEIAAATVARVRAAFASHADAGRGAAMAAYMRDQFAFFGLPAPLRRRLQREATAGAARPSDAVLAAEARLAWEAPERELQYFAADRLRRFAPKAGPGLLDTVEVLITTKSWWDTVDDLASHTVGALVSAHPDLRVRMDRWAASPSIWLVRAAILHQLRFGQHTDAKWLFAVCRSHAGSTEFFIRKAIGWALRTYAAVDPGAVEQLLDQEPFSGLTRREALRGVHRARRVQTL